MNWQTNLLHPPSFPDDEKNRQARLLNLVLLFNLAIWAFSLLTLPFSESKPQSFVLITAMLVVGVALRSLLYRGYILLVARMLVGFMVIISTVVLVIMGNAFNPQTAGYLLAIIISGLVLDIKSAIRVAILSTFLVLVLNWADYNGFLLDPPLLSITPLSSVALAALNIIGATGMIFFAMRSIQEAIEIARQRQGELSLAVDDNQRLLNSLEHQIEERTRSAETARMEAETARRAIEAQIWEKTNQARLIERMRGMQTIPELAGNVINQICQSLNAQVGVIYIRENDTLSLVGSYAYLHRRNLNNRIFMGDGVIGQAALEKQAFILEKVPENYMTLSSGVIGVAPRQILVSPFQFDGEVVGVVELASINKFTEQQLEFLHASNENIAIAFKTAQTRTQIDSLLRQTQQQASALQFREEELKATNEELQSQTENLRASQERLRKQQLELENANLELRDKAAVLQQQKTLLDQQNADLVSTQKELQHQAEQLAQANRYKSEFLANMSHELRTPLNSLLILSRMLVNNEDNNLTDEQVKSAQVIYNSGSELLSLINDILDLSKVEAGRMEFFLETTNTAEIVETLHSQFAHIANEKQIAFEIQRDSDFPVTFTTDSQRLKQILKNLISNAFKFTEKGKVEVIFSRAVIENQFAIDAFASRGLDIANYVMIQVRDSGIGIPVEKQQLIFEAFQQLDSSINRRYGGTGLGLAITREMISHLGGFISLSSTPGKGSQFSVYLPAEQSSNETADLETSMPLTRIPSSSKPVAPPIAQPTRADLKENLPTTYRPFSLPDDRHSLSPDSKVLLIIEDDKNFADIVQSFARKSGFKGLVARSGEEGLDLARQFRPQAILLDLHLPGISGWEVLSNLKNSPELRHIPVHIMSVENESLEAFQRGAIGYMTKPVSHKALTATLENIETFISRSIRTLLLVEHNEDARLVMIHLLSGSDIQITDAANGQQAIDFLHQSPFDCMILDIDLPDINGFEILAHIHTDPTIQKCPIILYTDRELTEEENNLLQSFTGSVVVKNVKNPERLLDETALFLHRVIADLPDDKQAAIKKFYTKDASLEGKHILIVDDDMRNSFAVSKLLGEKGVEVQIAANGQKALDWLGANKPVDAILMDIMMPVMDGFETIRQIRMIPHLKKIPILALTAKAMKGDRERCIEAGANDYLSKPLDPHRLFSMLRVWLYQ